jgi:small-conductance mechanosensitive channel
MSLDQNLINSVVQAIGLGLAVGFLLRMLRRYDIARRVWVSVLGVTVAIGLRMILRAAGVADEHLALKVITAIAAVLAADAILQLFGLLVWGYLLGKLRQIVVPHLLIDLFNAVVLAGVVLVVLDRVFGVDLTALLVTSTVVSAVIGLSLQDTLGNVIAGLALQMDRPFDVGDWVTIAGQDGKVTQMNWRTIMLRSLDNHWYVLPNGNVARRDIINYSRPTVLQRLHVEIGLPYNLPPGATKRLLKEAAAQAKGVLTDPAPNVILREFGESAILYDVRFWINDYASRNRVSDAVRTRIWYALDREGLSIPYPIRDVNLRQVPEDHERRQREESTRAVFALMRQLPVLAPLSDRQIQQLAERSRIHRYTVDELLVKQGDEGETLFIIKLGQTRVDVEGELGQVATVARLGPNDFFGEMSLLTGERRSASVVAESETEVVVLDKSAIAELLAADRSALEALSRIVEKRLKESAELVAAAASASLDLSPSETEQSLMARIQGFLGLRLS